MMELTGTAINDNCFVLKDGKYQAVPEIIIIVSEPIYDLSNSGGLVKSRRVETFRFSTRLDGLDSMIATLNDLRELITAPPADKVSQ